MMKEFVIKKNTPKTESKKVFYNQLINFFVNHEDTGLESVDTRFANASFVIEEYQHGRFPHFELGELRVFKEDVIKKFTPHGHRKANFFRALVAYMDCALCPYASFETENPDEDDKIEMKNACMLIATHFAPCASFCLAEFVKPSINEVVEKYNRTHIYNVSCKRIYRRDVEIEAESEEEAIAKALRIVDNSNVDCWEYYDSYEDTEIVD